MKITVAQFWTKNLSYSNYTKLINEKYCIEQGYEYYFDDDDDDEIKNRIGNRSLTWYKPFLIRDVFEQTNPDYVLFLDADAIIVDNKKRIEDFIVENKEIIVTEDHGPSSMNAGVILIKNSDWSKWFLNKWYDVCDEIEGGDPPRKGYFETGLWHDQTCFSHLLNDKEIKSKIEVIDNRVLNGRCFSDPVSNNFIFHAFSYGHLPNRTIDSAYFNLFNIELPKDDELINIVQYYATDKQYTHNYFSLIYNELFKGMKYTCKLFMEIGVLDGDSIKLWRDYFVNSKIIGVDYNLPYVIEKLSKSSLDRIELVSADQSKEEDLENLFQSYANIDIILDDGSHKMKDQQITFATLFRALKPGGIYIIEDLHTSLELMRNPNHFMHWGDIKKTITLEMLKTYINTKKLSSDYMTEEQMNYLNDNIESVEIYQSSPDWSVTGIIRKKTECRDISKQPRLERNRNNKEKNMISIIYHAYLVGDWKSLVKSQLERTKNSGLYDASDKFYVTINCDKNIELEAKNFFKQYPKLFIKFNFENQAEYPAIKTVRELGELFDTKILYFHTKGISNNWVDCASKAISQIKVDNVSSWRECLEYFLIDNWRDCVSKLEDFDNVGVSCNNGWYWGNFWWSKSSHIKKTEEVGIWGRWDYEAWLNKGVVDPKNYEYFHMGFNPYLGKIKPDLYNGNLFKFENNKIIVKKATYGTPPFEIDEGYSGIPLNITKDVTDVICKILQECQNKKISFNVNNETMGGDPAPGHRKVMIVTFYPEGFDQEEITMGATEGSDINFEFSSKNKISSSTKLSQPDAESSLDKKINILFLAYTSKYYKGHGMVIDRPDLTRKMSCLETWVPRVEKFGHEVIFFDGSNETQFFDKENKTLKLISDERYDDVGELLQTKKTSRMVVRLKEAIDWALKNREFDYIFRTDDGSYINAFLLEKITSILDSQKPDVLYPEDCHGGGGAFFSKNFCQTFVEKFTNHNAIVEDQALANFFLDPKYKFKLKQTYHLNSFYAIGELLFSMHYTNGKRQYLTDDIISYYYTGNPIKRKVVLGLPIYDVLPQEKHKLSVKTWDTGNNQTNLWYSFDKDDLNWEYYGNYARSAYNITGKCLFGRNSIFKLVLCDTFFDFNDKKQVENFIDHLNSITDDGNLYFYFSDNQESFKLENFILKLRQQADVISILNARESDVKPEFMKDLKGIFIKLQKKTII